MKVVILTTLVIYVAIMFGIITTCSLDVARGDELPPSIQACITDSDCEYAAMVLCENGYVEWCEVDDEQVHETENE